MSFNPKNWHWVNKDATGWTRGYLDKELVGISADENGVTAQVDKVLSMDGDVDVSQRKGKVITLFDIKLQLEYSGKAGDESATGTITIPEVAHDTEEDEYVFDIEIFSETSSKQPIKELVRKKITPQLRKIFATLAPTLITNHAEDIQHAKDHDPTFGFVPAKVYSNSSFGSDKKTAASSTTTTTSSGTSTINTTTVSTTDEFRTSAEELYATFTDPARLAAFTRAPPSIFEGAHVGGRFALFGGNIVGEYAELQRPTLIAQKWRLRQWPEGHYSRLEVRFEQNDVDAVTVMRVEWTGVPVGQEEVTRRNWGEYYVRSIKTTFGFGTIL